MTSHISQADPRTLSTEEILAEIDGFQTLAENVLKRWSALLAELKRRRVPDIMFSHPVLKFWQSINDRSLDARAAVLLADKRNGTMIRAVLPLPPKQQIAIAEGEPVPVTARTETGEIKSDAVSIFRMDDATLKRAFGPDGIRSLDAQAEMIRKEGRVKRVCGFTVLRDEQLLKAGNQKFTPEEVAKAMAELGWECRWVGGMAGKKAG